MSDIDKSNWQAKPNNEWSFVNVDKLFNIQIIKQSSNAGASFPSSDENLDGFKVALGGHDLDLAAFLDVTETDGFVVLHKGKLVHEYYAHANDATSKHILMSVTKSITSLVIGRLVEQGLLDTEARCATYVPELKDTLYERVTVRHCLDMRAGIDFEDGSSYEYRLAVGHVPPREGDKQTTFLEFVKDLKAPTIGAGGEFKYLSVNTDVLGIVCERASGKKLSELISEYVMQPAGAETNGHITVDSDGAPRAAGGMCASIYDLARIGQSILSGSVVSDAWAKDILNGGDHEVFAKGSFASMGGGSKTVAYRSCWTADSEAKTMIALGVFGQLLAVDLKNDIVVAKTSSQADRVAGVGTGVMAFHAVRRVLGENKT